MVLQSLKKTVGVLTYIARHPSNAGQRWRRLARGLGWQLRKRLLKAPLLIHLPNRRRFMAYPDCVISSMLIYSAWPEPEIQLFRREARTGDVLLDIGANVGHFSVALSDCIGRAILFEPNPEAARRARENLQLNALGYELRELAISDRKGRLGFTDVGGASPYNRVVAGEPAAREVEASTLDEQTRALERVDFVKIDVEGHEVQVLAGGAHLFTRTRPRLVLFEVLAPHELAACRRVLQTYGYRILAWHRGREVDDPRIIARSQNLLARPDPQT